VRIIGPPVKVVAVEGIIKSAEPAAIIAVGERVDIDLLLTPIDAIVELDQHRRRLRTGGGDIALRLHRLRHDGGILGELKPARLRRIGGDDEEALALRRGHRLKA